MKKTIGITIDVTKEMFENIIVTSLEGGSNYWYMIHSTSHNLDNCLPLSSQIAEWLYDDDTFKVVFHDCETDDYLGTLTQASLIKGIEKAMTDCNFSAEELEEGDAYMMDTILQYAVMGEVLYA